MPSESVRTFSTLLLCMSWAATVCTQAAQPATEYIWQTWTREHGLPMGRMQSILQTRDGYLWVGTSAGLARFDGRHWQVFNRANLPDLPSDNCAALAEDLEGNLWAGFKSQLFRWNGNTFQKFLWPEAAGNKPVLAMCASRGGGLWVIAEPGLWLLRSGKHRVFPLVEATEQTSLTQVGVTTLNETEDGLWIGRGLGITRFDLRTERFMNYDLSHLDPPQTVFGVARDRAGVHWVLHARGNPEPGWLSRFDNGSWHSSDAKVVSNGGRPMFLLGDLHGTLWFPDGMGSICRQQAGGPSGVALPGIAAEDWGVVIGSDREGGVWLGTEANRLLRWQPKRVWTFGSGTGLPHEAVWAVFEARDGSTWIGTDGGAIRLRDGHPLHYTEREGLSRNAVRAIAQDGAGRIWIGTGAGLNWIEDGKVSQYHFPGQWFNTKIRALLATSNHFLWVGTAKGLHCLRLSRNQVTVAEHRDEQVPFTIAGSYDENNGLPHDDIRALIEDREANLWIGTWGGGLYRFHDGTFEHHALPNEFAGDSAWVLQMDSEGAMWVGAEHGLARLKAGRWKTFTSREGLPEDSVNHVVEDNLGHLWLGGERGIYRLSKRELDNIAEGRATTTRYVTYDEDEGLVSRETNGQKNQPGAIKSRDGRLWFSTAKGVVTFDPKRLPDQTIPPPIVIEQIHASGETISTRGDFKLRPGAGRILEIHYTANTFVAPDKVRFKYRLDGLENNWTDAGTRRVAQYANLDPGKYRFQVLAANKYGIWNETGAAFAFTLAPFFWQTTGFKAAVVILPLLAAYAYYRRRIAQHRRHAESERRLAVSNERADIARDLHDHLGARLTLVQHLTQALDHGASANGNGASPRQKLTELARELNASLDSAVWAVQPDKDTLASLTDYLGDTFQELLGGREIELELDFPEPLPTWPLSRAERYHLALIAVEALNNVLKHAHATVVRLRLEIHGDRFTFRITDNGCGFLNNGHANRDGNGLSNMRQRMLRLGGQFEIVTAPLNGTTATITLVPSALRKNI